MRFIAVKLGRATGGESHCAFCCTSIGIEYVRDLQTGLTYHHEFCMAMHAEQSQLRIEDHARHVS